MILEKYTELKIYSYAHISELKTHRVQMEKEGWTAIRIEKDELTVEYFKTTRGV